MSDRTELVPVTLDNGSRVFVEATMLGGDEQVAITDLKFADVTEALEGIASSVVKAVDKVKPKKASVELGLEVALESGKLTALLVKGTGKANLKITLEWS